MRAIRFSALALGLVLAASTTLRATTIVPPKDLGALLRMSDAVVFAEAGESWNDADRSVPRTVTRFSMVRAIAGVSLPWTFEVEELGGATHGGIFAVAGSPSYVEGRRYLLFLARAPNMRWRSRVMAYGLLVEDSWHDRLRSLPEARGLSQIHADGAESVTVYKRDALLAHLESVARGEPWNAAKVRDLTVVWDEIHDDPAACQWLLAGDGKPFRVFTFASGGSLSIAPTTPGQTGIADGGVGAVQTAAAMWTNDGGSKINYLVAATHATTITCTGATDFGSGEAVFNDPCGDITEMSGCTGILGLGGIFSAGAPQSFHGELWYAITIPKMLVNNGAQCVGTTGFNEMVAHELGHSLGFGHHTDPNALMDGSLPFPPVGPVLRPTDQACAAYAYPEPGAAQALRRQELAALLLRASQGPSYNPPCSPGPFTDVTCGVTPYANYINDLAARGISSGCGGGKFCPLDAVTREQGAMLWLKTLGISQDACTGATGYGDVSCAQPFGPWIKELRDQALTDGCNGANTLFCPKNALTRPQLELFVSNAGLSMPPP